MKTSLSFVSLVLALLLYGSAAAEPARLKLLFLGDAGPHQPARRAAELLPALADRGIDVTYTDDVNGTLNRERLRKVDGLILYANIDEISAAQAESLLSYVAEGGGFIPLHCASYCFRNNDKVVALIGAQFSRHGTGVFAVSPTAAGTQHPIMQGYRSFQSWDETYVHTKHNEANRTVLEYRQEQDQAEPWTWVRQHGKGRVFYTAWGHDGRTFSQPGFHNLVERGIRWACGDDPSTVPDFGGTEPEPLANLKMNPKRTDVQPFTYIDVGPKIPNYVRSKQWGAQESPRNMMQEPLPPSEAIKHYVTPQGFRLELFASEPEIGGKPICMNWDHHGRLWIAETYDYPNEQQPEGKGRDRIRICEDTDHDGHADKFTVFAEQLSIPTSIAFCEGGLIVHQAPDTLFLQDTDGDDVADVRQVLFSGWKTNDTHAGPSNLNYGHDNWFYGMVGYAGFEGVIAGRQRSFRTGFYRFKVERVDGQVQVTDFEFLRNTNNNSWGVGFSEEGLLFGSTANRNPSEFMPIANRNYERVRGWTSSMLTGIADTHKFKPITDKIRQVDHHEGYTAAAGHALYTARRYPPTYWNRTAFVAGPTGHLVGTFTLQRKGAGFESTNPANLLASDDEWAAPIMAEVGPDGNVWVIDWYNYIVQHNPTPQGFENGPGNAYATDLRDKTHGRVYRVVYGQDSDEPPMTLRDATTNQLVDALASSNMFWRRHAQRLLVEQRDEQAIDRLIDLVKRQQVDAIGLDVGAIHALRTLDGLEALGSLRNREILEQSLEHPSTAVVRTAVELVPNDKLGRDALLRSDVFDSADAQVRLSALLAIATMPASRDSASKAIDAFLNPKNSSDRWMLDAATSAAAGSGGEFLQLACEQADPNPPLIESTAIVAEHVARSGDEPAVLAVVDRLSKAPQSVTRAVLSGWSKGWPKDRQIDLPGDLDRSLVGLLDSVPPSAKGQLIRLAKSWGSEQLSAKAKSIAQSLLEIAGDETKPGQQRIDAAVELIGLLPDDSQAATELLNCITPRMPANTATAIITVLQNSRCSDLGTILLERLDRLTPSTKTAVIQVMLARPETTSELLTAIEAGRLLPNDLSLGQQQSLTEHPQRKIRSRAKDVLAKSGGLPDADREKVLSTLLLVAKATGNATLGKAVYLKNCANCHTHGDDGKKVGPDLTGMAVHPKTELLTHILDPSRSVEGNYRSYAVLTVDGLVINGMLASETQTSVEIIDTEGKHHVVLREDIEQIVGSRKSVMPEGFEKQIDRQGLIDLLEFLTSRGKYLPLPLREAATAISTKSLFHKPEDGPDRLIFSDWSTKLLGEVPFQLVDPLGSSVANIVLLHGPNGTLPPKMPKSVRILCNSKANKIHLLGGVSGWGFPAHLEKSVSMTVRLHLSNGAMEDHELINGLHLADYIRRTDVPGSNFAMMVRGQQLRHVVVEPKSRELIDEIELIKGDDPTAPIVVAITIETGQ